MGWPAPESLSLPQRREPIAVTLVTDLAEFLDDHQAHGTLTADATTPAWNGYLLIVACSCGVVFERWVRPEDADADLLGLSSLN